MLAQLPQREVTPHRTVDRIFTGHFRSERGYYAWRPAGTDDFLLIYTLAGRGRIAGTGGATWHTAAGDFSLIKPGMPHDYGVEDQLARWELLWTHFRPPAAWLDLLDWPQPVPGVLGLTVAPAAKKDVVAQFRVVHQAALSSGPLRDRLAINALERLLLMLDDHNPHRRTHGIDDRVRQAVEYVDQNFGQRLTLDALADACGLSVSRLAHRFREVIGVAPMEYVERVRLERATQLLEMTSLSVKEIAGQVGYESQFYFSLRFKRRTGKSPTAYRGAKAARPARVPRG